jgi:hypothetical protein
VIPRNVQITLALLLTLVFASGVYILHLDRKTQDELQYASDSRPLGLPKAGTAQIITLAIAYDDDGVFRRRGASAVLTTEPSARAREVLETLIAQYLEKPSPHPLAPGSGVNRVYLVNQKLAVVDLNQALVDGHRSGIMVEDFTLMSFIETLSANMPQIEQVKILVNGKERRTIAGHTDLLSTYSTAAVHRLVEQLQ